MVPCTICLKYIRLDNLLLHNSLHFIEKIESKDNDCDIDLEKGEEFKLTPVTPKYKYDLNDNKVAFTSIPEEEQKPIDHDTCCICLSNNCVRGETKGTKNTIKPSSHCFFFTDYSLKQAIKSTINSPA
eukprot:276474_1